MIDQYSSDESQDMYLSDINPIEFLKNSNLSIYFSSTSSYDTDIFLFGGIDELVKFCQENNIKSVFVVENHEDNTSVPNVEKLKEQLTSIFKTKLDFLPSYAFPPLIPKDYYNNILDHVLDLLNNEILDIFGTLNPNSNSCNDINNSKIVSFEFYVIFEGLRVTTFEDNPTYSNSDNNRFPSEFSLRQKYSGIIQEELRKKIDSARAESAILVKEQQDRILSEITDIIKTSPQLTTYKTQRSRNVYADSIYFEYQEKGYSFLKKSELRDIVDREYYRAIK